MKIRVLFNICLAILVFASSSAFAQAVPFGDGGVKLQEVLDGITTSPATGSSTDVTCDPNAANCNALGDSADSYWGIDTGAVFNLIVPESLAGSNLTFGVFDAADPNNRVAVYDPATPLDSNIRTLSILLDGSVKRNFVDTGVDFAGNLFGFYITSNGGNTWFSETSLNTDKFDHLVAYQGKDQDPDTIQIGDSAAGAWDDNEYIIAWEESYKDFSEEDYSDFVVIVESITPVPYEPALGSLGDFVWNDLNGNGLQDVDEPGVEGVTVHLLNCSDQPILDANGQAVTTTTASDGSYLFANLPAGGYKVKFFAPLGYGFTTANKGTAESDDSDAEVVDGNMGTTDCIYLAAGENNLDVDAGLVKTASLGNYVWEDLNGNGLQDVDEPGVEGVIVNLYSNCNNDGSGGTFVISPGNPVTTNSDGFYEFTGLQPGNYCVEFVLPAGYNAFTKQNQQTDDAIDSDAGSSGRTVSTTLDPGENDPTWDAGVVKLASLGDFVWYDMNRNGIQDDGDMSGIGGIEVFLLDCAGNSINDDNNDPISTSTNNDGYYLFSELWPGDYKVSFVAPDGWEFTTPLVGDDGGLDSNADGNGVTTCITLESGENDLTWDAGLREIAASKLGDFVWHDLNANGIQDAGEPGIAGVKVELYDCSGTLIDDMTTDTNGGYQFGGLIAGQYFVKFDLNSTALDGFILSQANAAGSDDENDSDADSSGSTPCVTLGVNAANLTLDAGFYKPASLGDLVWFDANGNGVQNDGEGGVAGATVELFDCSGKPVVDIFGNAVTAVTTGATGAYEFDNLVPGGYTVKITAPDGYGFTDANISGSTEANDSDAEFFDGNMGTTDCITLISGENNPNVDAGLVELAKCDLSVNATCSIMQQPVTDFVCKDAKPIDTLQMIWNGQDNVTVVAHYGTVSKAVLETVNDVDNGELVSISGFAGSTNDVEWEVFDAAGNLLGISRFHLSCSDSNMNGPEDCGLPAGDGKDDGSSLVNDWLLEGMIGANGNAFQCTPPAPGPGEDSCAFTTPAGPHCQGKVTAMSLRYLGGGCTFSNTQEGKAKCLVNGSAGEPVRIRVTDGGSKVFLDVDGIEIGDVVEATAAMAGENELRSNTVVEIFSETGGSLVQSFEMHTSCSKPLNLGDQFASMVVIGLNTTEGGDASLGAEVVFNYQVVNNSIEGFIDEASDNWGLLGTLNLEANGGSASFSRTRYVLPGDSNVYNNTLSVSGKLESGLQCSAQDSVPVTREEPPAPQLACSEIKPITQLSMVWDGPSGVNVLTAGGQYFADVQSGNLITFDVADLGNEVGMTLSGSVTGSSSFHVSCSDAGMDGPEDCGSAQGNSKDDKPEWNNDWLLEAMIGETGSFTCDLPNTGSVAPSADPGTGGGGDSIVVLSSVVDGNRIKIEMENLSNGDLFIESVDFVWPEGTLKKMKFNGDFVKDIEKTNFGTAGSIMVPEDKGFEDDPNKRKIKSGEIRKLEIEFDEDLEKLGLTLADFTIIVTFDDDTMVSL